MHKMVAIMATTFGLAAGMAGAPALAGGFTFPAIEGGTLALADWTGKPVLVVNTASQCGYTPQYTEMQALQDEFGDRLVVLAVPSDDFRQELGSAEEVKQFCELNYNLTLPMTDISHVKGSEALPFYQWVKAETGFEPGWNFNKVLIGPDGAIAGTWGSAVKPGAKPIRGLIEAMLSQ